MATTFEQIITKYADRIGAAVGVEVTDNDRTRDGFIALLEISAERLSPLATTGEWLSEAASDLDAILHLGDTSTGARKLLQRVSAGLYDATNELEMQ